MKLTDEEAKKWHEQRLQGKEAKARARQEGRPTGPGVPRPRGMPVKRRGR